MSQRTRGCTSHCRQCGRHFAGDAAFDRHRAGSFKADPKSLDGRRCRNPENDKWFESVKGVCRIVGDGLAMNGSTAEITIYRRAGSEERLKGVASQNAGKGATR